MSSYKYSKETIEAAYPRSTSNSTILPNDRLKLVYNRFQVKPTVRKAKRFNVIFLHGTGMNKAIWNYYVEKLVAFSEEPNCPFLFNVLIAFDAVSHCDSGILNKGKVGVDYIWMDGSRDALKIVESETNKDPNFGNCSTIAIGHSLGGHSALMAGFLSPLSFDSIIAIEPVIYSLPDSAPITQLWNKMLPAVSKAIITEFPSDLQFLDYMQHKSFYRKFNPTIFKDFINDERIEDETGVRAKTSKVLQMGTYVCGAHSLPIGWSNLKFIPVPVLQITGAASTWNPPKSEVKVTERLQNCELAYVPEGTHLVHSELPDQVIQLILKFLVKRAQLGQSTIKVSSEIQKMTQTWAQRSKL